MYSSIFLDQENFNSYKAENSNDARVLENLGRINILIGPNNSGKSRFLRSFFNHLDLSYKRSDFNIDYLQDSIDIFLEKLREIVNNFGVIGVNSSFLYHERFQWIKSSFYKEINDRIGNIRYFLYRQGYLNSLDQGSLFNARPEIEKLIQSFKTDLNLPDDDDDSFLITDDAISHIYIPTLRGLRSTSYNNDKTYSKLDNFDHRTVEDYFNKGRRGASTIYTGFDFYEQVDRLYTGDLNDRKRLKDFESFIGDTFFEGQSFHIIPRKDSNHIYVSINNEDDKPIYDLGDGIQAIIILTYPLYFSKADYNIVFYEEPDLFLHPGYQRIFMKTISSPKFENFQFFFTTHSNHFLDMTLDYSNISVYTFGKNSNSNFLINNVENATTNVLQQLGVRNSSVFLTNCTIWVEGISDRIYLRKLLELIIKSKEEGNDYIEDIHFSFVEYGGNNITHWSFLDSEDDDTPNINVEKLCSKLFLITDSDGAGENIDGKPSKKYLRQKQLKKTLGDKQYYCLKGREIENLLNAETILKCVIEREKSTNAKISLRENAFFNENDKVGDFIEANVLGKKIKYTSDSGSLKNKAEFAKIAVSQISSFEDLVGEARLIAEKLYQFIKDSNT